MKYILRVSKDSKDNDNDKTLYITLPFDIEDTEQGVTGIKAKVVFFTDSFDCVNEVNYYEDIHAGFDLIDAYNHLKSSIEKDFKYIKDDFPSLDTIINDGIIDAEQSTYKQEQYKKVMHIAKDYLTKASSSSTSTTHNIYKCILDDDRKVEITLCDNPDDANGVSIVVFVYDANEDKVELTLEEKCEKTMLSLYHGFEDIINDLGYYGIDLHKTGRDVVQVLFCTIMGLKLDILKMKNDVQIYSRIVDEIEKAIDSKEEI